MTNRAKILLTTPIHADGEKLLAPFADVITAPDTKPDTLRRLVADADGLIVRAQLPDDIFDHAPRLRGVVRHGVGVDFVPMAAAKARGIPVANLPGSNTQAVAEYAIAALMHLRRGLAGMEAALRQHGWTQGRALATKTDELGGTTLGILGVGSIGRRIAQIGRLGFGMTVLGTSRRTGSLPDGIEEVAIDDLFSRADAIVIACPLTPETRGLVNAARIARMRAHAVLINVARGPVVETDALVRALMENRIGGAALDVFDEQPLPENHPLRQCPNTLLTPHVAGMTMASSRAMGVGSAEEMLRILRGEMPVNLVTS